MSELLERITPKDGERQQLWTLRTNHAELLVTNQGVRVYILIIAGEF